MEVIYLKIDKKNRTGVVATLQSPAVGILGSSVPSCTENNIISDLSRQEDNIYSELENRFAPKKQKSEYLSLIYESLGFSSRAVRVSECGSFLEFGAFPDGSHKLLHANFCRDRLCPMCNWRRSLKIFGQVSAVMDRLEADGYQFLFLTLTLKNCSAFDLPLTVSTLLDGFRKLTTRNKYVSPVTSGFFRSLEITRNKKTGTYHPHLHCILAVKLDYFHKGYISAPEWSKIWRKCISADYDPIINVKRIKPQISASGEVSLAKAVAEVSKYSVKGSDFLNFDDFGLSQDTTKAFLDALSFRRLISFTGVFQTVRKQLNLDDIETGDLVSTDIDNIRSDVAVAVFRYGFKNGCYTLLSSSKGGDLAG